MELITTEREEWYSSFDNDDDIVTIEIIYPLPKWIEDLTNND